MEIQQHRADIGVLKKISNTN